MGSSGSNPYTLSLIVCNLTHKLPIFSNPSAKLMASTAITTSPSPDIFYRSHAPALRFPANNAGALDDEFSRGSVGTIKLSD
jgi:hypothetical protein